MDLKINISNTSFILTNIIMITLSLFMLKNLLNRKKYEEQLNDVSLNYYEKSYFYKGANYIYNTIISILISLYSRNKIDIEKNNYTTKSGDTKTYYILKKINTKDMDEGERKILDILFSFVDTELISTRELNKIRKAAPDDYNKPFSEFISFLEERMKNYGLISREKTSTKSIFSFITFSFLFLIGSVTVYNGHIYGAVAIILSVIMYGFLITSFSKMTSAGVKKFRELEILEKNLKNIDIEIKYPTLVAIGFGLKYENIKTIYTKSSEQNMEIFFEDGNKFYEIFKEALVGNFLLVKN